MLKMYINDEEVISNQILEINEEMLNTSSTILNNCYPKSWETTKDYVNNFYYPQDYSKCKILSGDFKYGNSEFSILETTGNFETNNMEKLQGLSVDGNTVQNGIPSPSNPVNVETVKGIENLINVKLMSNSNIESINEDGTAILIKEFTSGNGLTGNVGKLSKLCPNLKAGDNVYLYFDRNNNNYNNYIYLYGSSSLWNNGTSRTITQAELDGNVGIYGNKYNSGETEQITLSNFIITKYNERLFVPYGSNYLILDVNNNKKLIDLKNENLIKESNIQIGKAWNGASNTARAVVYTKVKPNTKYTYNFNNISNIDGMYYFEKDTIESTTATLITITTSKTVTTGENTNYIGFQFNKTNITLQDVLSVGLLLFEGNTRYLQNELCKLENIKDELNINSNGDIILTKRVGKIVLNGTETGWVYDSTNKRTRIDISNSFSTNYNNDNLYCSHFLPKTTGFSSGDLFQYAKSYYFYIENVASTLNEFKSWLSSNNVTLYYQLEEETINLGNIQLQNTIIGNNVDTLITGLETNYKIYYKWRNYELIFNGVVENTGNISLRPTDPKYCSLQILDFKTFLSEGETLDFVINNKTVEEAIEMVVNTCQDYGVVLGNININGGSDIIGAYSTLDKTPYDVFQYLADITQSRWTTRMISENVIAVDFYDPMLLPKGEGIQYTKEWFENNKIQNLNFSYSSRDYRNKQVMTSNKVYANIEYTELLVSNGYDKTLLTTEEIGSITSITINGIEQTFVTNSDKELGMSADFYYSVESKELTSDDVLSANTEVKIIYIPLVQGRQVIRNTTEINRVSNLLDRKGVVSRFENRNDALSSDELTNIGKSYIKYKGSPEITLTIETQNKIWNIGDVVYFSSPIAELEKEYMVKSRKTKIIASVENVFYTYTLTSSFNSETEINYFDNQRNKAKGNLSQGQYIDRNIDLEYETNIIFDNLIIINSEVTSNNKLNSILESPFIN